ncbi:MAG: hypothetical protein MZV64_12685 [Ignavibacteriales bacterium]|nr:hypothetical protein [Ignavibacteriales bacterium]
MSVRRGQQDVRGGEVAGLGDRGADRVGGLDREADDVADGEDGAPCRRPRARPPWL